MRNIYDIITEQKAMVDVNMASYDLDYTISHMANNDYYMQEGLGDTVKNAFQKVVEFIKTVINKIRELVKKMLNFLLGKKSGISLDEINDALANGGGGEGSDEEGKDEKGEKKGSGGGDGVYDKNIHKGKTSITMKDIMVGSLRSVNIIKFADFKVKENITNTFLGAVNGTVGNHIDTFFSSKYENENKQLLKAVKRACFKGNGSFKKVENASMAERIALEVGEPKEPVSIKIKDIPINILESYIEADEKHGGGDKSVGKGIRKFLGDAENYSTKQLNTLKSKLEGARNSGDKIDESNLTQVQQLISMVGAFISAMTSNVFKAFNDLYAVYNQAKRDFCSAYNVQFN